MSRTLKIISFIIAITVSVAAFGDSYLDGKTFCGQFEKYISPEKGLYVSVPIDYSKTDGATTNLYYHFITNFDPNLPTFVLFTGGPGQSSHFPGYDKVQFFTGLGYNFLTFDQRGIACSRPVTETLYRDPNFYTSENVARDLDEIRKALRLAQVTVYGASYGTAPATIYCSLFPKQCKSLILEGTLFTGPDRTDLFDDPHVKLIQKAFDLLSKESQDRVIDLTERGILNRYWYTLGAYEILNGFGFDGITKINLATGLGVNFPDDQVETETRKIAQTYFPVSPIDPNLIPLVTSDQNVNLILTCKEFGQSMQSVPQEWPTLNKGVVTPVPSNTPLGGCDAMGMKIETHSTYVASNYPVLSPVMYIQGDSDTPTPIPSAREHFKTVPKDTKKMLVLIDGGHSPTYQTFKTGTPAQTSLLQSVFKGMLEGIGPSQQEVDQLNMKGNLKFSVE